MFGGIVQRQVVRLVANCETSFTNQSKRGDSHIVALRYGFNDSRIESLNVYIAAFPLDFSFVKGLIVYSTVLLLIVLFAGKRESKNKIVREIIIVIAVNDDYFI